MNKLEWDELHYLFCNYNSYNKRLDELWRKGCKANLRLAGELWQKSKYLSYE